MRVYISDSIAGETHADNVLASFLGEYNIPSDVTLNKDHESYSIQNVKDDMLIAYNAGYELFISSAHGGYDFRAEAISYYPNMLCCFPNGTNTHEEFPRGANYIIPEIMVICGGGDTNNENGYPIEFFDNDPTGSEPDASSFANPVIGAKLLKIKDGRNCNWTEAVQSARATASLSTLDNENGYGIIDVASAIAYSGTVKLPVGTITATRTESQSVSIVVDPIVDTTTYKIYRNKTLIYSGSAKTYTDDLPTNIEEAKYTYEGYTSDLLYSDRSDPVYVYRGKDEFITMEVLRPNFRYWELKDFTESKFIKSKAAPTDLISNSSEKVSIKTLDNLVESQPILELNTLDEYILNPAAEAFRTQIKENSNNFWNGVLPKGLITINGHIARFNQSYNKTHTSFYKRKAFLKLEVETVSGGTKLLDIGAFLFGKIENEKDSNTITLDDLSKPLLDQPADKVKAGYQWYRNVPVNFLVSELVKSVYYDERNGELPRDYIIQNIRPDTPNSEFLLSSQGKPPLFTKLTNNLSTDGVCRVLTSGDINGDGERLFLGIDQHLWSFNELTQTYLYIGSVSPNGPNDLVIKKLWIKDSYIYGVAVEKEQLVAENPFEKFAKNDCQIAVEFIFFKATMDGIEVLFDSQQSSNFNTFNHKLFTGEYHIIPPYFKSERHTIESYRDIYNELPVVASQNHNHYMFTIISGTGNFQVEDRVTAGTQQYKYPQSENISVPFAQKIGFICNRGLENYGVVCPSNPPDETVNDWYKNWSNSIDSIYDLFGHVAKFPEGAITNPALKWGIVGENRSRILIRCEKSFGTVSTKYHGVDTENDSDNPIKNLSLGIIQTYINNGIENWYVDETAQPEIYNNELPSLEYGVVESEHRILSYDSTNSINFYPGWFSWYEEAYALDRYNRELGGSASFWYGKNPAIFTWEKVAWPWIKFTSGQKGSVEYLPDVGNNGSIVFQVLVKDYNYQNSPTDIGRKRMQQIDLAYPLNEAVNSQPATPRDMVFKLFIFDLETYAFTELDLDDTEDQITAITSNGTDLYVSSINFNHSTDNTGNSALNYTKYNQSLINKYDLSDLNSITKTLLYDSKGCAEVDKTAEEARTRTITDLLYINSSLIVSSYIRSNVAISPIDDATNIPIDGSPFSIGKLNSLTSLNTSMEDLNNSQLKDSAANLIKLTPSKVTSTLFYYVELKNRNENVNKALIKSYDLNSHVIETLGYIEDIAFGDSNILSNLLVSQLTGESYEIVYGISNGYYLNPINKTTAKNYLFKYDKYLSGIIELADFSNMKVWDALTSLAEAFNYLIGFDNDKFFFLPKVTNSTPDIIIDVDSDDLLSVKKTQNFTVSNIISTIPYKSTLGDIQWSINLTQNVTKNIMDTDRTKLNVSLRVTQEDTLQKNITLKVIKRGQIPDNSGTYEIYNADADAGNEFTSLRFAYLVYHGVLETKLYRDVSSSETKIILPSFYGDTISTQLGIGDVFVINYQDPDSDKTVFLSRIIVGVDFETNEITLESALGMSFEAYTTVSIYKAAALNLDGSTSLKNNYWSSEGITFLTDDVILDSNDLSNIGENDLGTKVMSVENLGIGTVITIGNYTTEYIITNTFILDDQPYITFKRFNENINTGTALSTGATGDSNSIIRAYWVPKAPSSSEDDLIQIGGSSIYVGFETGSVGTFWTNSKGEDLISIDCPGLELTSDQSSKYTAVNIGSTRIYGNQEETLNDNRFIQKNLIEFIARNYLNWKAQPKLSFDIKNLVQAYNRSGYAYSLPISKIVNTSEKTLFTVRIRSKRFLPYFKDYSTDCYLMEYSINGSDFTQNLKIQSIDPY